MFGINRVNDVHSRLQSVEQSSSGDTDDSLSSEQSKGILTVVREFQPPMDSMHLRRQTPAVPLKLKKLPVPKCTHCSHLQW